MTTDKSALLSSNLVALLRADTPLAGRDVCVLMAQAATELESLAADLSLMQDERNAFEQSMIKATTDRERLRTALRRIYDNPPSDPNDTVEIAARALGILDVRAFGARPAVETTGEQK